VFFEPSGTKSEKIRLNSKLNIDYKQKLKILYMKILLLLAVFCLKNDPIKQCKAIKANGQQCRNMASYSDGKCFSHTLNVNLCAATTTKGKPCQVRVKSAKYCHNHKNQAK
jgi:hypothetical protein